jgi:VWFA-related protein
MTDRMLRCLGHLVILGCLVFAPPLVSSGWERDQGTDKTIFLSVVDASGKPVKGLTAAEFRLLEDGTEREVTSAKPATEPLSIALLADTTKVAEEVVPEIRASFTGFVKEIASSAAGSEITLMEFGQASLTITNFTKNTEELEKSIARLFPKRDAASVLLETLIDASNNLAKRPSPRRAIVVLNIEPSDEQSSEQPAKIQESLQKSRASLWAVSLQRGPLKNPKRDVVLNALTQSTGGRREFIVGQSAAEPLLKTYAETLAAQYELTYKRPANVRSAKQIRVGAVGENIKVYAPMFAPQ